MTLVKPEKQPSEVSIVLAVLKQENKRKSKAMIRNSVLVVSDLE